MKKKTMTAISIHVPNTLAKNSRKVASTLGISRAEFIRMAIEKAIQEWEKEQEIAGMLKAFIAMKNNPEYLKEAEEIMDGLNSELPEEEDEWWIKK